jgi:putative hemolysin
MEPGRRLSRALSGLAAALVLAACVLSTGTPTPTPAATATPAPTAGAFLPNPASVYCVEQGYRLEIRTATDGSQSGACIFADGSECDEWAFYRGECGPDGVGPVQTATATPALTPLPTVEGGYADWQTFQHAEYGFTFAYPPSWVVRLDDDPISTLFEHALFVQPTAEAAPLHLRVVFRRVGEDVLLWPTGVGEGEFIERGPVPFVGGELKRVVLVCQGLDQAVWYRSVPGGEIEHGGVEFSFILMRVGTCADGIGLAPAEQSIANMIVTSFH